MTSPVTLCFTQQSPNIVLPFALHSFSSKIYFSLHCLLC